MQAVSSMMNHENRTVEIAGLSAEELRNLYDSSSFENRFYYEADDLGAVWTPSETVWKLWSPVASAVTLVAYEKGNDEPGCSSLIGEFPMRSEEKGVWRLSLPGDCRFVYYRFRALIGGQWHEFTDPYARAAGLDGQRAMVVDLSETDPEGWAGDAYCFTRRPEEAIVWEAHVRDFSGLESAGSRFPGLYPAFAETDSHVPGRVDLPTGVAYLKKLGITHLQLLPVQDFATVDEGNPLAAYNWGYDPQNYNVPEGSYSTDPYHGEVRIREFKQMILALHKAGIGVIMDVVYNHTYESLQSAFHQAVPFFYHRVAAGDFANGSGCGSEIASERAMVRRYIVNSVLYWMQEYHIDGFRFDLMGLMDVETVNQLRRELNAAGGAKHILMYGEPWSALPPSMRAGSVPADRTSLPLWEEGIGFFSDVGRDAVRGSSFDEKAPGFIAGAKGLAGRMIEMASGAPDARRVVQYSSCHDNFTLWDKITATVRTDGSGFDCPELIRLAANKMAAAAILMSGGTPFLMGGEEFGRTKRADGNSYCSPLSVNGLDWQRTDSFRELVDYYRGLIAIRKAFLRKGRVEEFTVYAEKEQLVAWGARSGSFRTAVLLNASDEPAEVAVPAGVWQVLADETFASAVGLYLRGGSCLTVAPRGVLIAELDYTM